MTLLDAYIEDTESGNLLYDRGQLEVIKLLDNELKTLSEKYEFQTVNEYFLNPKNKIVVLRNDVDLYPENSLKFG